VTAPTVLHVGKFYPPAPGGMEKVVQLLCESERSNGQVDSRVLVSNTSARTVCLVAQGVRDTLVAPCGGIGSVGICPALPLAMARITRDVTVIHEPNPVALVSDWLTRQRKPLVVWFHSEVLRPQWKYRLLYQPFLRRALARAARIVVSSPNLAAHAAELQPHQHKCVVIPFGIDRDRLAATPEIACRVKQLALETPGPRMLFIGRLVPYKGVEVLLRAMTRVTGSAWIVGDGPLRESLEADCRRLGIADRVTFTGAVPDAEVVARLHACDVFVLPSVTHQETFGVVQIEAMACGKPVVSTNVRSGVPWVNRDGETGLVVEPGDAKALAMAIERLANDENLRRRMGEAGRARVGREFTLSGMAARTADLYRTVIAEGTAATWRTSVAGAEGDR
jgi:glycosyltransferase involved in cell wall biosynthesis